MLVTSVTSPCKITCSRLANLICGNLVAPLVEPVQNARTSLLDAALGRTACKTALLVFSHVLLSLLAATHLCFLPGLLCGPADIFQLVVERICVVDGQPWLCSVCKLCATLECLCCQCSLLQGQTTITLKSL